MFGVTLVFGVTCSPVILGETIKHHVFQFQNEFPDIVKILNRLYCDDLSFGSNNANDAFEIYVKFTVKLARSC